MIKINLNKDMINKAYLPLFKLNGGKRFNVIYGGAGSGKSYALAQLVLYKALKSKRRFLIIRKVATTIKDSVFDLILNTIRQWKLMDFCKINLSTYTITLPNESVLIFKGIDDPEKIKSIYDITDVWIEEATELTEDEFNQICLRVRAKVENQQIFCSFNPISKANWVYDKWFSEGATIGDDTYILKTTYKDNKFLPQEYIDNLQEMERTNPVYYRIYALGEFCSLDKLVYTNWGIGMPPESLEGLKPAIGLDFGFVNDLTALIVSFIDIDNKIIYIVDSWGATGKTNSEIAQIIINKGYSKSVIICDSAEPKSIEEIKRAGIFKAKASVKGPDSIIYGINILQQYKFIVNPKCEGVITELQNYSWKKDKKTGEYVNEPIDEFNHYLDALRYSMQCITGRSKLRLMDKKLLAL